MAKFNDKFVHFSFEKTEEKRKYISCQKKVNDVLQEIKTNFWSNIQKYKIKHFTINNVEYDVSHLLKYSDPVCPQTSNNNSQTENEINPETIKELEELIKDNKIYWWREAFQEKIYQERQKDTNLSPWEKGWDVLNKLKTRLKGAKITAIDEISISNLLQLDNADSLDQTAKVNIGKLWIENKLKESYIKPIIRQKIWNLLKKDIKPTFYTDVRSSYLTVFGLQYQFNFSDLSSALKNNLDYDSLEGEDKEALGLIAEIGYDQYTKKLKKLLLEGEKGNKRMIMVPIHEIGHAIIGLNFPKLIENISVEVKTTKAYDIGGYTSTSYRFFSWKKIDQLAQGEKQQWINWQEHRLKQALAGELIISQLTTYFQSKFNWIAWWEIATAQYRGDPGKVYEIIKNLAKVTNQDNPEGKKAILTEALNETKIILKENEAKILKIAYVLWIIKHLSYEEMKYIFQKGEWHPRHADFIETNLAGENYSPTWYQKRKEDYHLPKIELVWNTIENRWKELINHKIETVNGHSIKAILTYIANHYSKNVNKFLAYSPFMRDYVVNLYKLNKIKTEYHKLKKLPMPQQSKEKLAIAIAQFQKSVVQKETKIFTDLLPKIKEELITLTQSVEKINDFKSSLQEKINSEKVLSSQPVNKPQVSFGNITNFLENLSSRSELKWWHHQFPCYQNLNKLAKKESVSDKLGDVANFVFNCLTYWPYLTLETSSYQKEEKEEIYTILNSAKFWKWIDDFISKKKQTRNLWQDFQKEFLVNLKEQQITKIKEVSLDILTLATINTSYDSLTKVQKEEFALLIKNRDWKTALGKKIQIVMFWEKLKKMYLTKLIYYNVKKIHSKTISHLIKEKQTEDYDKLTDKTKEELNSLNKDKDIEKKIVTILANKTKQTKNNKWSPFWIYLIIGGGSFLLITFLGGIGFFFRKKKNK